MIKEEITYTEMKHENGYDLLRIVDAMAVISIYVSAQWLVPNTDRTIS